MQNYLRSVEVVAELRVHPATLRRYEKRGLITPLRDHNGVRYYTPEQVTELKAVISPRMRTAGH